MSKGAVDESGQKNRAVDGRMEDRCEEWECERWGSKGEVRQEGATRRVQGERGGRVAREGRRRSGTTDD